MRLTGQEQDQEQSRCQQESAGYVDAGGPSRRRRRDGAQRRGESDDGDEDAQAVRGAETTDLGEQSGKRVTDTDTDGGGDGQQRNGGGRSVVGEVIAGDAHHQRGQAQSGALGGAADEQPPER